jgi:hypothetical protein
MRLRLSLKLTRRRNRGVEGAPTAATGAPDAISIEQEKITAALVAEAETQVTATLGNADSHDAKALGLILADLAATALLISNHSSLNRFWWTALIPAGISAAGFSWAIWPRSFSIGPALDDLYKDTIAGSALAANVALLDALSQALEANRNASDQKRFAWALGGIVLAAATVGYIPFFLVVH